VVVYLYMSSPDFQELFVPTEPELIEIYGDCRVQFGSTVMTLEQALAFEAEACMADPAKRGEPAARVSFLAGRLAAAGSLLPDHMHLVPPTEGLTAS
jgi:hypothetical protein